MEKAPSGIPEFCKCWKVARRKGGGRGSWQLGNRSWREIAASCAPLKSLGLVGVKDPIFLEMTCYGMICHIQKDSCSLDA